MTGLQGTPQARLVSRLNITSPDGCWLWTGGTLQGHGQMSDGLAHRVAYEFFVGPIPDGMTIDHECHNLAVRNGTCAGGPTCPHRRCCNPWHLSVKSMQENLQAGAHDWSKKDTCKWGHPRDEGRYIAPDGRSMCRECRRERDRKRRVRAAMERRARRGTIN